MKKHQENWIVSSMPGHASEPVYPHGLAFTGQEHRAHVQMPLSPRLLPASWLRQPASIMGLVPPGRRQQQLLTILMLLMRSPSKVLLYPDNQRIEISLTGKIRTTIGNIPRSVYYRHWQRRIMNKAGRQS